MPDVHGGGGSAFPTPGVYIDENVCARELEAFDPGLTAREYLTAHAPPMPEGWPTPQPPHEWPPRAPFQDDAQKMERWAGWGDYLDDGQLTPEELAEFQAFLRVLTDCDERNKARRVAAMASWHASWAVAWADAVLAELRK